MCGRSCRPKPPAFSLLENTKLFQARGLVSSQTPPCPYLFHSIHHWDMLVLQPLCLTPLLHLFRFCLSGGPRPQSLLLRVLRADEGPRLRAMPLVYKYNKSFGGDQENPFAYKSLEGSHGSFELQMNQPPLYAPQDRSTLWGGGRASAFGVLRSKLCCLALVRGTPGKQTRGKFCLLGTTKVTHQG